MPVKTCQGTQPFSPAYLGLPKRQPKSWWPSFGLLRGIKEIPGIAPNDDIAPMRGPGFFRSDGSRKRTAGEVGLGCRN
jgi:hypothetical protein